MTFEVAAELYGKNSAQQLPVQKGWDEVGIVLHLDKRKGCGNIFGAFMAGFSF